MGEIDFGKYAMRGAYHWEQVSYNPLKRNSFVLGRYNNAISLVESALKGGIGGRSILDIGCGDGVLAWMLAKRGARVSGIDSSDLAIQFAREKTKGLGIDFRRGSACELPWKDDSFDAAVCSDVIEHVKDVEGLLSEMRRVIKPGGHVVISTPIRLTEKPLDREHAAEWFPSEFQRLIKRHFPNSRFCESHPVAWMELALRSRRLNILLNLLSPLRNPFAGFQGTYQYKALQWAVCAKE